MSEDSRDFWAIVKNQRFQIAILRLIRRRFPELKDEINQKIIEKKIRDKKFEERFKKVADDLERVSKRQRLL